MTVDRRYFLGAAVLPVFLLVSGCATWGAQKKDPTEDLNREIAYLQGVIQAKDKEIQKLEKRLEAKGPSSRKTSAGLKKRRSSLIRVSGVSPVGVQQALIGAGFDPGPVDGKIGKKTKRAIRAFQRSQGLVADGIVGKKTWGRLKTHLSFDEAV